MKLKSGDFVHARKIDELKNKRRASLATAHSLKGENLVLRSAIQKVTDATIEEVESIRTAYIEDSQIWDKGKEVLVEELAKAKYHNRNLRK